MPINLIFSRLSLPKLWQTMQTYCVNNLSDHEFIILHMSICSQCQNGNMTHYWNVKRWMLRVLCSCTALQRKTRKVSLYCNSPGKVPTLSSNRSMIGLTEFCWDQKLNRKLFIEINFDATVVKVVFLHGTKLLSKIKVSHLPFPSLKQACYQTPHAIIKGGKWNSLLCSVLIP